MIIELSQQMKQKRLLKKFRVCSKTNPNLSFLVLKKIDNKYLLKTKTGIAFEMEAKAFKILTTN